MLERDLSDGILTLRLAHGKVSALDLELCDALRAEFENAGESADVRAIVITGSGSTFSAGVDLRAIFLFPKPAIAAINGHAIAGGAIIAFACDYRLMSAGRIGVPEALVGVPFPPLALEVVRFAVPRQHLQPMLYLARTVEVAEAKGMGIIDEVMPAETLLARAQEIARKMAEITPAAFRLTKRQVREPFLRDAAEIASVSAGEIDAQWADPAVHTHIRQYLAKTIGKR
ncbi:MAG: enoyl-CoA hydratase/isomerase family protein [Acidobacteria bacterium]|nr:MAG: enoyl-CoA hydratase/isomerase family protein [Acidobacteriota bacterium]